MIFQNLCVRSTYEKKSLVDSAAHVKDEKIMGPLLEAKERWGKNPIEKISIETSLASVFGFGFRKETLYADFWLHKDFQHNNTIAVLVHGFSDSASGLAYLAESYHERGITTLSVNLRAHAESAGKYCGLGCYLTDGKDITLWVKYLRKRFGCDTNIILHGVSMGGASVIQAAFKYSLSVVLVVSDCTFSEYSINVKTLIQRFFPKNIVSSFFIKGIYSISSILNLFTNGFLFKENAPKKILENNRNNPIPLIIFHGEKDTLVNPMFGRQLYESAAEPKKLVTIKDAPHIGSLFYDKEKYMSEVLGYLQD